MASLNLENCLNIPDDFDGYSKTLFNIPKHYEDCVGNVLIPAGLVQVSDLTMNLEKIFMSNDQGPYIFKRYKTKKGQEFAFFWEL